MWAEPNGSINLWPTERINIEWLSQKPLLVTQRRCKKFQVKYQFNNQLLILFVSSYFEMYNVQIWLLVGKYTP